MENDFNESGAVKMADKNVFAKTFLWMFLGLFLTGAIGWYVYSSGLVYKLILNGLFYPFLISELVVVVLFSLFFRKLPPIGAAALFFLYAAISGISFSVIFTTFELVSIILIFFISAIVFGIFALIGYFTNIDFSKWYPYLIAGLVTCIIVSIINLFVGNGMLDIIISWVVLLIFFGVTAYDIQKIKTFASLEGNQLEKAHIYGAMELYLDFVNIFLRILNLFGKRK